MKMNFADSYIIYLFSGHFKSRAATFIRLRFALMQKMLNLKKIYLQISFYKQYDLFGINIAPRYKKHRMGKILFKMPKEISVKPIRLRG